MQVVPDQVKCKNNFVVFCVNCKSCIFMNCFYQGNSFCKIRHKKSLLNYLSMNNHVSLNSAVKASFVLRMDNSVHWIKLYPVDSAVYFVNTYMDSF